VKQATWAMDASRLAYIAELQTTHAAEDERGLRVIRLLEDKFYFLFRGLALISVSCYTPVLMASALRPPFSYMIFKKKWRTRSDSNARPPDS
jgi:hypothetical protein